MNNDIKFLNCEDFNKMTNVELEHFVNGVTKLLSMYPDTMLQYSVDEIKNYIFDKKAFGVFNQKSSEIIGFVKIMQWLALDLDKKEVYEFGSWVVDKNYQNHGLGKMLLQQMLEFFKKNYTNSKLIAVVESQVKGQPKHIVLEKCGGKLIKKPSNVEIKLTTGQEDVLIYQLY